MNRWVNLSRRCRRTESQPALRKRCVWERTSTRLSKSITVTVIRHSSWEAFETWRRQRHHRLILFTTAAPMSYLDHAFERDDLLLFGRESAGVPEPVHNAADARLPESQPA